MYLEITRWIFFIKQIKTSRICHFPLNYSKYAYGGSKILWPRKEPYKELRTKEHSARNLLPNKFSFYLLDKRAPLYSFTGDTPQGLRATTRIYYHLHVNNWDEILK